jgi:enoyl-[acyl-carrier-protein] reductase (NADH)
MIDLCDSVAVVTEAGQRIGDPTPVRCGTDTEEIAGLITYLGSDLAGFVTVDPFVADGGYTHL